MTITIPLQLVSHELKIARLYKTYLRTLRGAYPYKWEEFYFKWAVLRNEFDAILCEKDMRISKQMLIDKEIELKNRFVYEQVYFPDSPKGTAYQREMLQGDWILDCWDPLEKAIYPTYFKKREIRKQQFIEMWNKIHGPPPPKDD